MQGWVEASFPELTVCRGRGRKTWLSLGEGSVGPTLVLGLKGSKATFSVRKGTPGRGPGKSKGMGARKSKAGLFSVARIFYY